MRPNPVKRLLKSGQPAVGTWLSLASITAARFLARSGLNWLCVDIEHSLAGIETSSHIFGAVADAGG
ncbi:MAG: 2-dehydro-3-deoxyglucarate aldolase, partial [Planctomycetia bacterium]|nr:2-dehydro-3-deoxyglucarate aldolase [Planctomycetia bacterium]